MLKTGWLVLAALVLTACGAPQPQREGQRGVALVAPATGPGIYRIDARRSSLRLLVYRAGAMARLGHNHVISAGGIDGWVKYSGEPTAASLTLSLPVDDFVIDDPELRAAAGPDFAAAVPEDARTGTRHNMLSDALLDAARFPDITLHSEAVRRDADASAGAFSMTLAVNVAGHASTVVVPFMLAEEADGLRATGSVTLRQSALGLVPYSVMLGALQVQDEFTVEFDLWAVAT